MKKTYSLLVVDSNPYIRGFIKRELGNYGYQVAEAANIQEIRAWIQGTKPLDLIIIDPDLPDASETHIIHQIHAVRPNLPLVLHAFGVGDHSRGNRRGITAFIQKSGSSIEDLKKTIASILPLQ
ncbi:MAG: response regulator [Desulfobacterales bacterium]